MLNVVSRRVLMSSADMRANRTIIPLHFRSLRLDDQILIRSMRAAAMAQPEVPYPFIRRTLELSSLAGPRGPKDADHGLSEVSADIDLPLLAGRNSGYGTNFGLSRRPAVARVAGSASASESAEYPVPCYPPEPRAPRFADIDALVVIHRQ